MLPTTLRALFLGIINANLANASISTRYRRDLIRRATTCGTDPAWEPTPSAYTTANTTINLASWWSNVSSGTHDALPSELAKRFGSHQYGFTCGVGDESTCYVPGCSDFESNGDPPWTFLALQSISRLNVLINRIYDGVVTGQLDYQALIGNVSEDFFSWTDPGSHLKSSQATAGQVLSALGGALGEGSGGKGKGKGGGGGGGNLFSFVGEVVDATTPSIADPGTKDSGMGQLGVYVAGIGQSIRDWTQQWANTTFNGDQTSGNQTLL
jgi:hypothetical protein